MIANSSVAVGFTFLSHPNGEVSLLKYPFLTNAAEEFEQIQTLCIIGLALWCVLGFSVILFLFTRLPRYGKSLNFRLATASVTIRFQSTTPWWFVFLLIINLLLSLTATFFEQPYFQMFFMCMVLIAYGNLLILMRPYVSDMAFLVEYVATLAKLLMVTGAFLFEATRQGAGFILSVVIIGFLSVFVLIISSILEFHKFEKMPREDAMGHCTTTRDASRLAQCYDIPLSFLPRTFPFVRLLEDEKLEVDGAKETAPGIILYASADEKVEKYEDRSAEPPAPPQTSSNICDVSESQVPVENGPERTKAATRRDAV